MNATTKPKEYYVYIVSFPKHLYVYGNLEYAQEEAVSLNLGPYVIKKMPVIRRESAKPYPFKIKKEVLK